jgi:glycosyltransferase involved in cell wall biosynthesis
MQALAERGCKHDFILFVNRLNRDLFAPLHARVEFVEAPPLADHPVGRIVLEQVWLPQQIQRWRVDVMHYPGTAGSFLIRHSDVVTVHHDSVTQRASMSWWRNLYYDLILRFNRRAGLIIAPSQAYAEQLIRYYGYRRDQMRAIHHGTSTIFTPQTAEAIQDAREKWGIAEGAILSITNTLPHKNLRNLLQAFERLKSQYGIERQLVLVGNVRPEVLDPLIESIAVDPVGLRARIRVLPFMPHEQLPPIYGAADMFAFMSLTETFGMPLTEAMGCGVPIVASELPVHMEILQGAGLMVDPQNVEAITHAMFLVLKDDALRSRLRQDSLSRAQAFTWSETAREMIGVYEEASKLARVRN